MSGRKASCPPGGQQPGLGLATHPEKTAEMGSRRNLVRGLGQLQSAWWVHTGAVETLTGWVPRGGGTISHAWEAPQGSPIPPR